MNGKRLRLFALLGLCAALGPLQLNVYLPSLPLVQAQFDAGVAAVQWTVSLAMVSFGLSLLLLGPLSDRLGRRPVLLWGMALFVVASLVAGLAQRIDVLAISRALQSAGAALAFISARAVVADLTPREELQRRVAQLTMIVLTGQMVAPLIGNAVMSVGGWRSIQLGLAGVGAAIALIVLRSLRETLPPEAASARSGHWIAALLGPTVTMLRQARFNLQLVQIGLLYSAYPAFVAIAPHLMIEVFQRPPTHYGYYFALLPLGYFTGNGIVLRYGRNIPGTRLIRIGSAMAAGSALLSIVLLASGVNHPLALFGPAGLLLNTGLGIALPSATARAIGHAWPNTASGWGLTGFSQQVIGACGVQLLGFFAADTAMPVLVLCVLCALLPVVFERWLRPLERTSLSQGGGAS